MPRFRGGRLITMTRRARHTPEQIVRKLRKAEELAAEGKNADEIARALNVSTPTYYSWRKQYGQMTVDDAKELRRLRDENARLKRLVAEKELENLALKDLAAGTFRPGRETTGCDLPNGRSWSVAAFRVPGCRTIPIDPASHPTPPTP